MAAQEGTDWREQATVSVEKAASIIGISRSTAYEGAHSRDIPVIKIGRRLLVPTAHLQRMLGEDPTTSDAPAANRGAAKDSDRVGGRAPARAA
jgi:excisionase family DNA binding protein